MRTSNGAVAHSVARREDAKTTRTISAARRAALVRLLQERIGQWQFECDPGWGFISAQSAWKAASGRGTAGGDALRRLAVREFELRLGPLPPLPLFEHAVGSMALLDPQSLQARLCALALLGRPGVLRSCVQREAREALQATLGPAYPLLRERSRQAPAVPAYAAAWTPLAWVWIGWRDLLAARAWPHRTLRRLARALLPSGRAGAPRLAVAPRPIVALPDRLKELDLLFPSTST
ncbi:MAG TPA: type III secretion protein HrpB4 [Burkholderiaceae bacterium]|nr:type III secretion protein HrpB4 [Burkholderiaceae bacterium]